MLASLVAWIDAQPASQAIQNVSWAIPTIQSIHILAIAIVMASSAMLDLRLMGLIGPVPSVREMTDRFAPWIWIALVVLGVSGVMMVMGEPKRALLNPLFQIKMGLLVLAVTSTLAFQWSAPGRSALADLSTWRRRFVKLAAGLSLGLWVCIVIAGRWIAYTGANGG
jgi:hypothetical protein